MYILKKTKVRFEQQELKNPGTILQAVVLESNAD